MVSAARAVAVDASRAFGEVVNGVLDRKSSEKCAGNVGFFQSPV